MNKVPHFGYWLVAGSLSGMCSGALAYEVNTHADLSARALVASEKLAGQLDNLGLQGPNARLKNGQISRSLVEWVREGAIHEDDTNSEVVARYRNHFFDPVDGTGFGGIIWRNSGIAAGLPSPDWALEDTELISGQLYSFRHARQYMLDGLTLATKADRERQLAMMFRSLGDVLHLVQDAGQPQHTRNDGHGFPGSLYERYTDLKSVTTILAASAPVPVPFLASARDVFTNASGTGIAQYSNRNFVSTGTNFLYTAHGFLPSKYYAFPVPLSETENVSVQEPSLNMPQAIRDYCGNQCVMQFVSSANDKGEIQPRAATLSIFSDDIDTFNQNNRGNEIDESLRFSLNRINFDAMHTQLLPRAVSYSTGMLDYFFRGSINLVKDPAHPRAYLIQNNLDEAMEGTFGLYYDDYNDQRQPMYQARWQISIPAHGQSPSLSFAAPDVNDVKREGEYLLVFSGQMGQESPFNGPYGDFGAVVAKRIHTDTCPFGQTMRDGFVVGDIYHTGGEDPFFGSMDSACAAAVSQLGLVAPMVFVNAYGRFTCFGEPPIEGERPRVFAGAGGAARRCLAE